MNTREYISSGILESYVLGAVTPDERREVEKYAAMYPEIKQELEAIEQAMNSYATEHRIEPPSYLKERIFAKIADETNTGNAPIMRALNENAQPTSTFSFRSMAASLVFLISAGCAIYFGMESNRLNTSLNEMAKANSILSDSIKAASSTVAQMQSDMTILKDPGYKMVELKGLKIAPDAKAMVCWRPMDKKVYVEIQKLPSAPQGMQYQLWAIVDGKPVSEGMLTAGIGLHPMKDVDNAQAFAITLEKEGGSPNPKGDMYVMGAI